MQGSWFRRLSFIVWQQFWLKTIGITAFTTLFFVGYVHLLKHPYAPVTTMPTLFLDRWIGFEPLALIPYLSLWVYVSLPPVLMESREDLVAYGLRIAPLCLVGLGIFYVWPTAVPVSAIDWTQYPSIAFIKGVDAAGNACPSLHVATAVYSAVWLGHILAALGAGRWVRFANWAWCIAIVYSTIATRQHVAIDVFGGLALGGVAAWLSLLKPFRFKVLAR